MTEPIRNAPYGMSYTNRAELKDLMSKNNFTTEAPLIFAMYLDGEYGYGPNVIEAVESENGQLATAVTEKPLSEIFGLDPRNAYFAFEKEYDGYHEYALNDANRSDVVVIDRETGQHESAFEVKLCVVPNSDTAGHEHDMQSCEIVVRPPSIEQLAFSIADTYGNDGRQELGDLIVDCLGGDAQGYRWSDQNFMLDHLDDIRRAVTEISETKLDRQQPFVMMGLWRTEGQSEILEDHCFDTFVWTNFAFMQLLQTKHSTAHKISRPDRSLIWLVKALYDYSIQQKVDFNRAHSMITFDAQTDKAAAFAGDITRSFLTCERFNEPRIGKSEISDMLPQECIALMKPERRLDAALKNSVHF